MNEIKNSLSQLFRKEVAKKGNNSAKAFGMFSLFTFYFGFGLIEYIYIIKVISIILFIVSMLRFYFSHKMIKQEIIYNHDWFIIKTLIWLNTIGWSVILNLASFELKLSGTHFIVVTTMIAGFIGASLVSLSYFSIFFIPFQLFMLLPQILIIIYFYFSPLKLNFLPLVILYLMYLFYQIKSFKSYRSEILKMFKYQKYLEEKNLMLKASKEELVEQTFQLVHASRLAAVGEMSAGLIHEINNPVTIINSSAKLISNHLKDEHLDRILVEANTDRINRSIHRITQIVKGLKNLTYQSEHLPKEAISLNEIIDDTNYFCKELLFSKTINLKMKEIPDVMLNCHAVQISQVLINLIKNAVDVLSDVQIPDDKWIAIEFKLKNNIIEINLSNGGKKITRDVANKLFTPFFTTKPIGLGSGLGLSISKKIMKEHDGDLNLDQNHQHTCFVITLPIK